MSDAVGPGDWVICVDTSSNEATNMDMVGQLTLGAQYSVFRLGESKRRRKGGRPPMIQVYEVKGKFFLWRFRKVPPPNTALREVLASKGKSKKREKEKTDH